MKIQTVSEGKNRTSELRGLYHQITAIKLEVVEEAVKALRSALEQGDPVPCNKLWQSLDHFSAVQTVKAIYNDAGILINHKGEWVINGDYVR